MSGARRLPVGSQELGEHMDRQSDSLAGISTDDLSGRRAIVTGGTGGIGASVARSLVAHGAEVLVTGTRASLDEYDNDDPPPPGVEYRQLQLADAASIDAFTDGIDGVDILVNNAGVNMPGGRDEYDPDTFTEVVALNLTAPYRLTHALRRHLADSNADGGASVVWVESLSTKFGIGWVPAYSAAKGGVGALARTLAVAWGDRGIRVNAVAPGVTRSRMTEMMMGIDSMTAPIIDRTPLGRIGVPDDIAPAVTFLAGPGARFITGQTLYIDGGYSIAG